MNSTSKYVSFNVARILKEKEFNEICFAYYIIQTKKFEFIVNREFFSNSSYTGTSNFLITAPTEEQVIDWIKKEFKVSLENYSEETVIKTLSQYRPSKVVKEPKIYKKRKKKK